jgi:hypothetical protein
MPGYHVPENDASSTVATPRAAGGASLVLANASRFGDPADATQWNKLATITRGPRGSDTFVCILEVTGRSGNTLAISRAVEGPDADVHVADNVYLAPTKLALTEIHAALDALAGPPGGTPAAAGPLHAVQASDGAGGFAGTADFTYAAGLLRLGGSTYGAGQTILFVTDIAGDVLLRLTDTGALHIAGSLTVGDAFGSFAQVGTLRLVEDGSPMSIGTYSAPAGAQVHLANNAATAAALRIVAAAGQTAPLVPLQGISSTGAARDLGYVDARFAGGINADATYLGEIHLILQDFGNNTGGNPGGRLALKGVSNGTSVDLVVPLENLRDAADDTAAAALTPAVPVGGLYRTGSALKVRIS